MLKYSVIRQLRKEQGEVESVQAANHKILIVDDQTGVRRLLFETFTEEGFQVETASSGVDALKKIAAQTPDLVLLDIKMPVMNGLATLREIRKTLPDLMVVMMTAYGELDMLKDAKKLNVNHYLIKPFDLDEIRYLVKGLLQESNDKKVLQEIV